MIVSAFNQGSCDKNRFKTGLDVYLSESRAPELIYKKIYQNVQIDSKITEAEID